MKNLSCFRRVLSVILSLVIVVGVLSLDMGNVFAQGSTDTNLQTDVAVSVPTGLAASYTSSGSNKITWDAVTGASGYVVYKSMTSGTGFVAINDTAALTYTNTGLVNGTVYYYKVKAYINTLGGKVYSAATAAVFCWTVPRVVTGIKVESLSITSQKISWTAVAGATGYQVYSSTNPTGSFSVIQVTAINATYNSLVTGTTYYYKVVALKDVGAVTLTGALSAVVSLKVTPPDPTNLQASSTYNSIYLSWNQVTGATGYEIYRSGSASSGYVKIAAIGSPSIVNYTNSSLTTGKKYYYKVKAYTTVGPVNVYSPGKAIVSAIPRPVKPAAPTFSDYDTGSITLNWSTTSGANGYTIYRSTSASSGFVQVGTTTSLTYTNKGLTNGTAYYYKIKAYRISGTAKIYSDASAAVRAVPHSRPVYSTWMSGVSSMVSGVTMIIRNDGTSTLRIYQEGCTLEYYPSMDVGLTLPGNAAYIDIAAGATVSILFKVVGTSVLYTTNSAVWFKFSYDTVMYIGKVSYYQNLYDNYSVK